MNIALSLLGCFLATETGVLITTAGLFWSLKLEPTLFDMIKTSLRLQIYLLPMMVVILPLGLLARVILGHFFSRPLLVALIAGGVIGLLTTFGIIQNMEPETLPIYALAGFSGFSGGFVWWFVERKHLRLTAEV